MRCVPIVLVAAALVAMAARCCVAGEEAEERKPMPSAADLAKAKKLVKELLGAEITSTKPAGRAALAAKILKQANEAKDDAAGRFVLLCEARDIAAKAGDPLTAAKAADDLALEYKIGAGEAREALAALATAPMNADNRRTAADVLVEAAEAAVAGDDCDVGLTLYKAADVMARKARNFPVANQAKARIAQVEKQKTELAAVKEHQKKLIDDPNDPAANLALGRYLCLTKHDWDAALPHLAKGATGTLKDAVDKDLKAAGGDEFAKIAAADAWYDMAARANADNRPCLQLRAYHWYLLAAPKSAGLQKAKADKRIKELQAVTETASDKTKLWLHIRRALADGNTKRWPITGGAFAKTEFEEVPSSGALLIGFRYTVLANNGLPGVVQPIFLTASGEVLGKIYGTAEIGATPQIIKAKPGYAVGAINVRGGGGIDAFQPIFMRIREKDLDRDDKYDGPKVGGTGGGEGTVGGDGNFIIGLHGKVNEKGKMEAMSAVSLTTATAAALGTEEEQPTPRKKRARKDEQ
jgi:hypothetical protein